MSEHVEPNRALSLYVMMNEKGSEPPPVEAQCLFTSLQQQFGNLRRWRSGPLLPPVDSIEGRWSVTAQASVTYALHYAVVGAPEMVRRGLEVFMAGTGDDELLMTGQIFDHATRLRSLKTVTKARDALADRQADRAGSST